MRQVLSCFYPGFNSLVRKAGLAGVWKKEQICIQTALLMEYLQAAGHPEMLPKSKRFCYRLVFLPFASGIPGFQAADCLAVLPALQDWLHSWRPVLGKVWKPE